MNLENEANIWSAQPPVRLQAARQLSSEQKQRISNYLLEGCPTPMWPFGNPTVINPYIVTLGASPGGSPAKEDRGSAAPTEYEGPAVGFPHRGIYYPDSSHFWDKMRLFSHLTQPQLQENDAESLFGHLNLDVGSSGQAIKAGFNTEMAQWVMQTIIEKLRPRFVVMIGLGGYLKKNPAALSIMNSVFFGDRRMDNCSLPKPSRVIEFKGYSKRRHVFKEWDISRGTSYPTTLVNWPQHPSRAPFSNREIWEASCREFALRHEC